MIVSISIYFLQSAICMAFFYALYWLFLKNDTFFWINRLFLLLTLLASILIPSLDIPFRIGFLQSYPVLDAVVNVSQQYLTSNMLDEIIVTVSSQSNLTWYHYLGFVYLFGVSLFVLRFVRNLNQLLRWIINNPYIRKDTLKITLLNDDFPPFSFLNRIFISNKDYQRHNFKNIFEHEKVHVNQFHTFDLLLLEILTAIFWLNPFVWFYKSSLQEVHEYLADAKAVRTDVNPVEYKKLIVNQFVGDDLFRLANNFGHSTLKNRILMLGRIKTPKIALVKLLLLFPIVLILLSAFAFTVKEENKIFNDQTYNHTLFTDLYQKFSLFDFEANVNQDSLQFVDNRQNKFIQCLTHKDLRKKTDTYVLVDEMPEYPGGIKALNSYIKKSINYPHEALKKSLGGRVFISFVVSRIGEIVNAKVIRGIDPSLDEEALRIIRSLPKWKPGKLNGVKVNVSYTIPIHFLTPTVLTQPVSQKSPIYEGIKNKSYHFSDKLFIKKTDAFKNVEKMPKFPGGTKGLRKFIARKLRYPTLAAEQGYEGQVFVRFLVSEDGFVRDVEVLKGANIELNQEAIRVIKNMPRWVPAEQSGKKVAVNYTVPIRFALN